MFGATIVTAVLVIEDLFLTVLPIRKGEPEIGIGNVIGSLVFSVTGKLGESEEADEDDGSSDPERAQAISTMSPFKGRFSGWFNLGLAVLALGGIIIGAATVSEGTEQILDRYGIEGTVFGATFVTAVLCIEDLFLTVQPIRKGVPEIGIGNVIGSLVFSVTGKLGIIVLAGGTIAIGSNVLRWHLPVLVGLTALAAFFLSTGQLKRWHGYLLLALYIAYWIVSFSVYGGAPVED